MSKAKRKVIQAAALNALQEHGGRWKPAAEQLVRAVRGRRDSTFAELARIGAYYLVRRLAERDRRLIKTGHDSAIHRQHGGASASLGNSGQAAAALQYRGMWGYSLMGGLPLGDARGNDLDAEIALRWKMSTANAAEAQMLERIRARVGDKKVVRDVLTPEELDEMRGGEKEKAA